jgi:hypothetical protein
MTVKHRWWLCALLAVGMAPQVASAQVWGDLPVSGGVPALRRAVEGGRADQRPDALWLSDFIRRVFVNTNGDADVSRVRDYFEFLLNLERVTAECPEGCRLVPASAPGNVRDRIRQLLTVLGLDRDGNRDVTLASSADAQRRQAWLVALGVDPGAIAAALNANTPVHIRIADGVLPLPLPDYFAREVLRPDREGVMAILDDRKSALLYLALIDSDPDTVRTLASRPALVRTLHHDHAAAFHIVSGALRLTADGVDLPGGAAAAPAWEELVGRKPSDGDRFIRGVLSHDAGRLAYFFSMVGHFDAARQAFVLGAHLPPRDRVRFVERIYRRFVVLDPGWSVLERPLIRPDFDPALAFGLVEITSDGTVGPAWWPSLFERITGSTDWPDSPQRTLRALKDTRADALWLINWLFEDPTDAETRFRMLRFAQRQFAQTPRNVAPALEVSLRASRDMPTLPRALERMGIVDPYLYEMLALAGRSRQGNGDESDMADLRRWQAALALVEQVARRHPPPPEHRIRLLTTLASVGLLPKPQRPGALAAWLADTLLTAYGTTGGDEQTREEALLTAFTRPSSYSTPAFSWEGLDYVFDPAPALARGVLSIRRAVRVPRLVDVVALQTIRTRLEAPFTAVDELRPVVEALQGLSDAVGALPVTDGRPHPALTDFDEVLRNLTRLLTRPRDLNRVVREVVALRRVIDHVTETAMISTAFALASVPTSEAPELFATRFARHVFIPSANDVPITSVAWQVALPEAVPSGGTVLRGSLLGLDLAIAESLVRSPGSSLADGPPVLSGPERAAILMRMGINPMSGVTPDMVAAVAAAIAAGRATLAGWSTLAPSGEVLETALREAGTPADEVNVLVWDVGRDGQDVLGHLGAGVSFRLGGGTALPPAWGPVGVPAEACWCARTRLMVPMAALRGRRDGSVAATDEELVLRLVELMAINGIPGTVLTSVVPYALFDWLENVQQASPEDGTAVRAFPLRLDVARFEQYLLHLTAEGVFAPPKSRGVQ